MPDLEATAADVMAIAAAPPCGCPCPDRAPARLAGAFRERLGIAVDYSGPAIPAHGFAVLPSAAHAVLCAATATAAAAAGHAACFVG